MKTSLLTSLLFFILFSLSAKAEELVISASGNSYVTQNRRGAKITDSGIEDWKSPETVISFYFYLQKPEKMSLSLNAKGDSRIRVSYGENNFDVDLKSDTFTRVPVGEIETDHPGYVRIDLQGISRVGKNFGEIKDLIVDNVTSPSNYVKDFSDYWGRRGPSVHMAYQLPEGDTEWFYNEVTVPQEGEVLQSYYMADGFGEGYFGMQYNSPHERRILFSVWSPFDTQNPEEIPDSLKIKLLRKGEGVYIGEFGNEGSGGQSYLRYPWKAGETYRFLMQVKPDNEGNTSYTAYFYPPEEGEWKLIASFLRPQTTTWYKRPHSFLENFNPEQGYLTREVYFGNQWARSKEGVWTPLSAGTFTHDATAKAKVRLDYQGGTTTDNRFLLKMGGFFDESTPFGSKFNVVPSSVPPDIDWEALETL